MTDRPASVSFERVADRYDETRGGEGRGRSYAGALEPLFARRGWTLDVGVGTGVVARGLRDLGRTVIGIDISIAMLFRAQERVGGKVALADATRMPIADRSIDDAYSVWVLHLVSDVRAVLTEVARVLHPGGRYLVIASARKSKDPIGRLTWEMNRRLRSNRPSQDSFRRMSTLARDVGLRVLGVHPGQPEPFSVSPESVARDIEARVYSALWDVSDDLWREAVVPTIEALRALPNPNQPITRRPAHDILVLER